MVIDNSRYSENGSRSADVSYRERHESIASLRINPDSESSSESEFDSESSSRSDSDSDLDSDSGSDILPPRDSSFYRGLSHRRSISPRGGVREKSRNLSSRDVLRNARDSSRRDISGSVSSKRDTSKNVSSRDISRRDTLRNVSSRDIPRRDTLRNVSSSDISRRDTRRNVSTRDIPRRDRSRNVSSKDISGRASSRKESARPESSRRHSHSHSRGQNDSLDGFRVKHTKAFKQVKRSASFQTEDQNQDRHKKRKYNADRYRSMTPINQYNEDLKPELYHSSYPENQGYDSINEGTNSESPLEFTDLVNEGFKQVKRVLEFSDLLSEGFKEVRRAGDSQLKDTDAVDEGVFVTGVNKVKKKVVEVIEMVSDSSEDSQDDNGTEQISTVEPGIAAVVDHTTEPKEPIEPIPKALIEPAPKGPIKPALKEPIKPAPKELIEPAPKELTEPTPKEPIEPTPKELIEPTPDEPRERTPDEPREPTPNELTEPTPEETIKLTPTKPRKPTPKEPIEPTPNEAGDRTNESIIESIIESVRESLIEPSKNISHFPQPIAEESIPPAHPELADQSDHDDVIITSSQSVHDDVVSTSSQSALAISSSQSAISTQDSIIYTDRPVLPSSENDHNLPNSPRIEVPNSQDSHHNRSQLHISQPTSSLSLSTPDNPISSSTNGHATPLIEVPATPITNGQLNRPQPSSQPAQSPNITSSSSLRRITSFSPINIQSSSSPLRANTSTNGSVARRVLSNDETLVLQSITNAVPTRPTPIPQLPPNIGPVRTIARGTRDAILRLTNSLTL